LSYLYIGATMQLVSTLRVDPEFKLIYFNPNAKVTNTICLTRYFIWWQQLGVQNYFTVFTLKLHWLYTWFAFYLLWD